MAINPANIAQLASGLPSEIQESIGAALRAQDKINSDVDSFLRSLLIPAWQTPNIMLNGWLPFSSIPVRFTKYLGLVFVTGAMTSGTIGQSAFTLPVSYRPQYDVNLAVESNDAYAKLRVEPSGVVVPVVGNPGFYALDGCIFFPAEGT